MSSARRDVGWLAALGVLRALRARLDRPRRLRRGGLRRSGAHHVDERRLAGAAPVRRDLLREAAAALLGAGARLRGCSASASSARASAPRSRARRRRSCCTASRAGRSARARRSFAALALATSLEFVALSRIAFTDMLLLLWLTVCIGALHRAFEAPGTSAAAVRHGWFALACVAAALAILTKGAIGVLFPGAVALAHLLLWGRLREMLRPGWIALALPLVLGVGFSWYLLLGFTQPGGFAFMRDLFLEHHVGRFSAPMQGHAGSPLYYLPVLAVGLLPVEPLPAARDRARGLARARRARALPAPVRAVLGSHVRVLLGRGDQARRTTSRRRCRVWRSWSAMLFARSDGRERERGFAWSFAAALALRRRCSRSRSRSRPRLRRALPQLAGRPRASGCRVSRRARARARRRRCVALALVAACVRGVSLGRARRASFAALARGLRVHLHDRVLQRCCRASTRARARRCAGSRCRGRALVPRRRADRHARAAPPAERLLLRRSRDATTRAPSGAQRADALLFAAPTGASESPASAQFARFPARVAARGSGARRRLRAVPRPARATAR